MSLQFELPKVIGHRGACGYAPENTMAAFDYAHQLGISWVEFDVQLSADNEIIIFHDDTLNRTTNGNGPVKQYVYEQLKSLDAGSYFDSKYDNAWIPTLSEVLSFLNNHNMHANIEFKTEKGQTPLLLVDKTLELLSYYNIQTVVVSSFNHAMLKYTRHMHPTVPIGLLYGRLDKDWEKTADELQVSTVHVDHKRLSQSIVGDIKQSGYLTLTYTVNDPKRATTLFEWGVSSVFSDYPDKIL